MNRQIELAFSGTEHFSMDEWPDYENTLDNMNVDIFEALFDVRSDLPKDHGIYPSPLVEAHIRWNDPGSRHNLNKGERLSDATDFFVKREHAKRVWATILTHSEITGLGIYQNSLYNGEKDKYTMFHVDTRPQEFMSMWVATRESSEDSFEYYGYLSDTKEFFKSLAEKGFFD